MSLKHRIVKLEIQLAPKKEWNAICGYIAAQLTAAECLHSVEQPSKFPEPPPGVDPVSCPEAFIFGRNQQEWDACMAERKRELARMMSHEVSGHCP